MHTPKVIIHRLHTPRPLPRRRRIPPEAAGFAGIAVLLALLAAL
jgi:hypothetical protein